MVAPGDVWSWLAPYSFILVIAILAVALYALVRGAVQRMGTTAHKSAASVFGLLVLFVVLGLWLYYTGFQQGGVFLVILAVIIGIIYAVFAGRSSANGPARRRMEA